MSDKRRCRTSKVIHGLVQPGWAPPPLSPLLELLIPFYFARRGPRGHWNEA
jgi:hypothetical protein